MNCDSHIHPEAVDEPLPGGASLRFLSGLLDTLAKEDQGVHEALLAANPDLAEYYGDSGYLREKIHTVLDIAVDAPLTAEQKRRIECCKAEAAKYRAKIDRIGGESVDWDAPGILTSVTRHVPPEKAIELYRKIAPIFVYQLLKRLNQSASVRVVSRLVDHLCCDETQHRLRACDHVREGILEELRFALGLTEIEQKLSLAELERLLEESGAINDLMAMENCIRLAAAAAG